MFFSCVYGSLPADLEYGNLMLITLLSSIFIHGVQPQDRFPLVCIEISAVDANAMNIGQCAAVMCGHGHA